MKTRLYWVLFFALITLVANADSFNYTYDENKSVNAGATLKIAPLTDSPIKLHREGSFYNQTYSHSISDPDGLKIEKENNYEFTIKGLKPGTFKFIFKANFKVNYNWGISFANGSKTWTYTIVVKQINVTSVTLNKSTMTLETGSNEKLTATVLPTNATNKTLSWRSSNENVAFVNSEGVVSAINPGKANIIATATDGSGKNANCVVTVKDKQLATGISLNKTSATMWMGDQQTLTATVTPSTASQSVTWKSSNTSVATVSSAGVVTAKGKGAATITATTSDGTNLSASCSVTVKVKATGISLNKTSATMWIGDQQTLAATVTPSTASQSVTWKSSNTSVATVSSAGVVTAKNQGAATITATTSDGTNLSASCVVTVKDKQLETGVWLNKTSASMFVGDQLTLTATVTPSTASQSVTWKSSNTNVATVSSAGVVTAKGKGTATITVTTTDGSNLSATCEITVMGFKFGDVNGDGQVNGSDVTALYNCLLNGTEIKGDGDVSCDGIVNGSDITYLYNLLLDR